MQRRLQMRVRDVRLLRLRRRLLLLLRRRRLLRRRLLRLLRQRLLRLQLLGMRVRALQRRVQTLREDLGEFRPGLIGKRPC